MTKVVTLEGFKLGVAELWDEEKYLQVLLGPNIMEDVMSKLAYKLFGEDSVQDDHKTPNLFPELLSHEGQTIFVQAIK